jgi:hypothetical protein
MAGLAEIATVPSCLGMMTAKYPLFDLVSDITCPFEVGEGLFICTNDIDVDVIESDNMSAEDKEHLLEPCFCLTIHKNKHKPEVASITFIISARLIKRSKVFIRYRVDNSRELIKIRDDYPCVTFPKTTRMITSSEFQRLCKLLYALDVFKNINTRTSNAVYFLGMAYRSRKWLESLLFHVCALETLTSASERETNVTNKFADRIHDFIGYDKDDIALIYNIRSELVHGRYQWKSREENGRLNRIAEEACRKVFGKILLETNYSELFKDDNKRLDLFENG